MPQRCSAQQGGTMSRPQVQNRFWMAAMPYSQQARREHSQLHVLVLKTQISINYTLEETETNKTIFVLLLERC